MRRRSIKIFLFRFFVVMIIVLAGAEAQADLNVGLVAYYPFNGNTNDESGNENHGTVSGSTQIQDRFGNEGAYYFDGNDYISVSSSPTLNISTEFTISVWIKPDQQLGDKSCIIGKYSSTSGKSGPQIKIQDNSYIVFEMSTSGVLYIDVHSDPISNLFNGEFHHIVCTRDVDNLSKIYFDGQMVQSGYLYNNASNNQNLVIGTHSRNIGSENFKGIIDDIRIYNRSLTVEEIDDLYNETADSDEDGIPDTIEDANHNGEVDPGETDPNDPDTDNDGIQDGTENGYTLEDIHIGTNTSIFVSDADPATTTDPLLADTDDDGIWDGVEDPNHNGKVDPGESDPNKKPSKGMPWLNLLLGE